MEKFWSTATDTRGWPLDTATITVYETGTVNLASLFSDSEGNTPKSNPFATDDVGRFSFYAASGRYDVQIEKTGKDTYTLEDIQVLGASEVLQLTGGIMTGSLTITSGQKIYLDTAQTSYLIYENNMIKIYVNGELVTGFTP